MNGGVAKEKNTQKTMRCWEPLQSRKLRFVRGRLDKRHYERPPNHPIHRTGRSTVRCAVESDAMDTAEHQIFSKVARGEGKKREALKFQVIRNSDPQCGEAQKVEVV